MTAPVIAPSEAIPAASSHFRPSKRPHSCANSGILFSGDNLSENTQIKRWYYHLSVVGGKYCLFISVRYLCYKICNNLPLSILIEK